MTSMLCKPGREPTLALLYAFLATQAGRDKCYRTLQYYGKYVEYRLKQTGDADQVARAKLVKHATSMLSLARKLYRMFKWLENWHKAAQLCCDGTPFTIEKSANVTKNVCGGFYYWYDMFQWLHAARLVVSADKQRLDDTRNYFWIARIAATAVATGYKLDKHNTKLRKARRALMHDNVGTPKELAALRFQRTLIVLDAIRNCLDITAPLASLKSFDMVHNGVAGSCGTVASLIGVHAVWNK